MNRRTVRVQITRHSSSEVLSTETVPKYRDKNWSRILEAWQVIDHNCQAYKILSAALRSEEVQ